MILTHGAYNMEWESLSMHPDRGIVRMDRRSDGIYTRPNVPKTLTHQYSGTDNAPRDKLFKDPLNEILTRNGLSLCNVYVYGPGISSNVTITASTLP